jgi:membrane protein required for colicin V production
MSESAAADFLHSVADSLLLDIGSYYRMTVFDYVVLLILAISIVISVIRGLVREVLSLASWIGAFFVAKFGAPLVSEWLPGAVSHPGVRLAMGFVLVMVATVLLFSLVSVQVAKLVKFAGLKGTDRMLGAFFGFARGLVISVVVVLIVGLTPLPQERYWRDAMFRPPLETAAGWMRPWLPEQVHDRIKHE